MTTVPAVSVCIPARNSAAYLAPAIDSVLAQEHHDFELVVVDNASTDETAAICARYDDPRFRVARFEESVGQAANWNRCLDLATADYVVLLHSDDELRPGFLKQAVQMLEANQDVGLVHCTVQHIDEAGSDLELQRVAENDFVDRNDAILRRLLLGGCLINVAGVMVRKDAYERVGRFTERVVWGVDWHMWIRLAMERPVGYLAEPLARYREHTQSGTSGVLTSVTNAGDERWVIDDVFRIAESRRPDLTHLHREARRGVAERTWWWAELMCKEGEPRAARKGLRKAIAMRPSLLAQPRTAALFAATFLGYDSFQRARGWRRERHAPGRAS
jgi:glycosyltransferase involved in cell wall biosynthesis